MDKAKFYIENLELIKHPEGGWYREVYRSTGIIKREHLPERFSGDRHHLTSIYFLLGGGDFSAFHRIKSDEQWHFYDGNAILIHMINDSGNYSTAKLGKDIERGEVFQFTVPQGTWFAAEVEAKDSFALVGCTVAPGFHFDDFEMGEREALLKEFPGCREIVERLTLRT